MADALFARQAPGHMLQPTAVVHEAWLELAGHERGLTRRNHFLAVAVPVMRQVLTDHARVSSIRGDSAA